LNSEQRILNDEVKKTSLKGGFVSFTSKFDIPCSIFIIQKKVGLRPSLQDGAASGLYE
jgi:hypothetical protein